MTKKDKRKALAAAALAALGWEDDDEPTGPVAAPAKPAVPARTVTAPAAGGGAVQRGRSSKDRGGKSERPAPTLGAGKQASVERPPVRPDLEAQGGRAKGSLERAALEDLRDVESENPKMGRTSAGVPYPAAVVEVRGCTKPKKFKPGDLKIGDCVWYRGERYWITFLSQGLYEGCYARIEDKFTRPGMPTPAGVTSFNVHVDMLDLAPPVKNLFAPIPTMAAEARKERAKAGQTDIGDEVAMRLRACETLDDVYKVGAEFLEQQVADLKAKYAHLNPGQQRMVIGNRMRAEAKKRSKR